MVSVRQVYGLSHMVVVGYCGKPPLERGAEDREQSPVKAPLPKAMDWSAFGSQCVADEMLFGRVEGVSEHTLVKTRALVVRRRSPAACV
jgi:hypothetical protein